MSVMSQRLIDLDHSQQNVLEQSGPGDDVSVTATGARWRKNVDADGKPGR